MEETPEKINGNMWKPTGQNASDPASQNVSDSTGQNTSNPTGQNASDPTGQKDALSLNGETRRQSKYVKRAEKYEKYRFPGQKDHEKIQALVRKHWVINIKIGLLFAVLGLFPVFMAVIIAVYFWDGSFNDVFLLVSLGIWLYLLGVMGFTYMSWLNEELDIIIVTNERVVAHDQVDLFHREISETSLSQIQDVKGVEQGLWGNVLHYGMIEIQTAAKDISFNIKHASNPYEKARDILDIRDTYLGRDGKKTSSLGQ